MITKTSFDSETSAHGQQVITACAFIHSIFDGVNKVFLPRRAMTKKFLPGVFELPGGHINFGEDIVEGLKREILEEFEMNIAVGDPFAAFTYVNQIKGSHSIEVVYFARFISPIEQIVLHPEDHSEFRWVGESEIMSILDVTKQDDDHEIAVLRKGFGLLRGESVDYE